MVRDGKPLVYAPLMGLAYQMGALLREPIELTPWQYYAALILSVITAFFAPHSPILLFLSVFLLSVGIQGARGMISEHHKVGTLTKRASRIVGFAFSGLLFLRMLPLVGVLALLLVLPVIRDVRGPTRATVPRGLRPGPLGWTMLFHQTHYFCYAYMIPVVFAAVYNVEPGLVGVLFCVGWVSYISSRSVFGEERLIRNFAVGHVIAAITLAVVFWFYSTSFLVVLAAWFMSGFGGGTVYCLRELRAKSSTDRSDLDSWESIGHVVGVAVCLAVLVVVQKPQFVFAFASAIALFTCAWFLFSQRRHLPI